MAEYIKNETWGRHRAVLFAGLLGAIILLGAVYIYSISAIMIETVNRDYNIRNLQIVQKEYQELEKSYLFLLAKFNLDYVYSLGFVPSGNTLSFLTSEIKVAQNNGYDEAVR